MSLPADRMLVRALVAAEADDSIDICSLIDRASPEVRAVVAAAQRARIASGVPTGCGFGGNWRPVGRWREEPQLVSRDNADKYVRDTVLFASVLFLVTISQRFKAVRARVAIGVIAFGLLIFVAISLTQLPRL